MKIAVVGAGPAGLYFSLLTKKQDPRHEIVVVEQNPRDATYGWGVVFSDVALAFLKQEDPEFYDDFMLAQERCDYMEVVHRGVHVPIRNNFFSRIARLKLLTILQNHCERVGVKICFDTRITDSSFFRDFDVIVGADGANSMVRKQFESEFRPSFQTGRNKFAWYGTSKLFVPVSLIFRQTQHGVFAAHSYQYSENLSTFLVETDPETWSRAGIEHMSDDESRRFCAEIFREDLGGETLLSNRSMWFQAVVIRNERWFYRNVVLIGDAVRTVHFSLGSGTRMAMQDSIALCRAFRECGSDVQVAFREFERVRRPHGEDFQESARKSLEWYENLAPKMSLDPVAFAYDYMRRTGKLSHEDLRQRDPEFVLQYERTVAKVDPLFRQST